MIESIDPDDAEAQAGRCCIGGHKFLKSHLRRPEIRIDGLLMCESHYMQINQHGLDNFRGRRSTSVMHAEVLRRRKRDNAEKAKIEDVRKSKLNQPGFVYYIRMDSLIKIGYAHDVAQRMRAYPPSAELLAIHPGTPKLEREVHGDFKAFLRRGREWFEPHEVLMQRIAAHRMRFGDPSRFAYEYTRKE